jgi:tetratricopeptide (TPR) repeat protein
LKDFHPALSCELADQGNDLIIYLSFGGEFEALSLAEQIVMLAPIMTRCTLELGKPPSDLNDGELKFTMNNGCETVIREGEVFFSLFPGPLRVDVIVHFESSDQDSYRCSELAEFIIQDLVGEYERIVGVGHIHVCDTSSLTENSVSLRGFVELYNTMKYEVQCYFESILSMDEDSFMTNFSEQYEDVFSPFTEAKISSWDVTLELWGDSVEQDLESLLMSFMSDLVIELREQVSLVGSGVYTVVIGTMSGFNVVEETEDLVRVLVKKGLLPVGLVLDIVPDGDEARLQAGQYLMLGEAGLAVRYYRMALREVAEDDEPGLLQFLAAMAHFMVGFDEDAARLFEEALLITDSLELRIDILENYAYLLHCCDDHSGALKNMLLLLKIGENSATRLFNVASTYGALGNVEEALEYLRRAWNVDRSYDLLEQMMASESLAEVRRTLEFKRFIQDVSG